MKADPCKLEISLSKGEIRVVYLRPHSVIFGVKGHITLIEQVTGLGEAGFNLYMPIRHGDMHLIAYGGRVVLEAEQYSKICAILPELPVYRWTHHLLRWMANPRNPLPYFARKRGHHSWPVDHP